MTWVKANVKFNAILFIQASNERDPSGVRYVADMF